MTVGTCKIDLHLVGVRSLKEKRGILKSLIAQITKKFNAAVAEVDYHDVWQTGCIGVVVVSTSSSHAEEMLINILSWIEHNRPDLEIDNHTLETIVV